MNMYWSARCGFDWRRATGSHSGQTGVGEDLAIRHARERLRRPAADIASLARANLYMASRRIAPTTALRASARGSCTTRYPAAFGACRSSTRPVRTTRRTGDARWRIRQIQATCRSTATRTNPHPQAVRAPAPPIIARSRQRSSRRAFQTRRLGEIRPLDGTPGASTGRARMTRIAPVPEVCHRSGRGRADRWYGIHGVRWAPGPDGVLAGRRRVRPPRGSSASPQRIGCPAAVRAAHRCHGAGRRAE